MDETQLMNEYSSAAVSGTLFVFVMALHLICGQTNYYITLSKPVVNRETNDLLQWR